MPTITHTTVGSHLHLPSTLAGTLPAPASTAAVAYIPVGFMNSDTGHDHLKTTRETNNLYCPPALAGCAALGGRYNSTGLLPIARMPLLREEHTLGITLPRERITCLFHSMSIARTRGRRTHLLLLRALHWRSSTRLLPSIRGLDSYRHHYSLLVLPSLLFSTSSR